MVVGGLVGIDTAVVGIAPMVVVNGATTIKPVGGAAIILVNMLMCVLMLNLATKHEHCA